MMHKKDCRACGKGGHPILFGMTLAFAAVGVAGVVMAMRRKGNKLKQAAAEAGCACMDEVRGMTETALEGGVQMMDRARQKMQSGRGGQSAGGNSAAGDNQSGAAGEQAGESGQNGAAGEQAGGDAQSTGENGQSTGENGQSAGNGDQSEHKAARRGRPRQNG